MVELVLGLPQSRLASTTPRRTVSFVISAWNSDVDFAIKLGNWNGSACNLLAHPSRRMCLPSSPLTCCGHPPPTRCHRRSLHLCLCYGLPARQPSLSRHLLTLPLFRRQRQWIELLCLPRVSFLCLPACLPLCLDVTRATQRSAFVRVSKFSRRSGTKRCYLV